MFCIKKYSHLFNSKIHQTLFQNPHVKNVVTLNFKIIKKIMLYLNNIKNLFCAMVYQSMHVKFHTYEAVDLLRLMMSIMLIFSYTFEIQDVCLGSMLCCIIRYNSKPIALTKMYKQRAFCTFVRRRIPAPNLKQKKPKSNGNTVFVRFMMSAACSSRAGYHLFQIICSSSILDMHNNNNTSLVHKLTHYGLNNQQGIMPHKSKVLMAMLSGNNINVQTVYKQYGIETGFNNVIGDSVMTDTRVIAELPTLVQHQKTFGLDIDSINANGDKQASVIIPGSKQSNPDFTTCIKLFWNKSLFTKQPTRLITNDQKSGTGMLTHSTSGSLGCLYFDSHGQPIRFMTNPYTYEQLLVHDMNNLMGITSALQYDKLYTSFSSVKTEALAILNNNTLTLEQRHNAYQMYMWKNVQLNPKYNRALSLIFCETVDFDHKDESFNKFQQEFLHLCDQLKKNTFDLDKRGDSRIFTNILINAYEKTVDATIKTKLQYLKTQGIIEFNKKFLQDFADILKKNAFFT